MKGRGNRNSRFPSQSMWIERKIFCVSPLIPGRSIRVVEILKYKRFSVDFKAIEVLWFIGALRKAGKASFGDFFSKRTRIGCRSMVLSVDSNRAGVYIKMECSIGGRNRRRLLISAGEKGDGWLNLANLLATISSGGEHGVKRSDTPASKLRWVVRGKDSSKEKSAVDVGWNEGFLPELLKHGMDLCVGAPSSSAEASRYFAWKPTQSEQGLGLLVVETTPRSVIPSLKISPKLVRTNVFSGGEGFAGEDDDDEPKFLQAVDEDGVSIFGNSDFEFQNLITLSGATVNTLTDVLGGGPTSSVLAQPSSDSRALVCSEMLKENTTKRALVMKSGLGSIRVNQRLFSHILSKKANETLPFCGDEMRVGNFMGCCDLNVFFPKGSDELSQRVLPDTSCGGAQLGMGDPLDYESDTNQTFESPFSLSADALIDMSSLAKHEDITIMDNEEALSLDSPVFDYSDCSVRVEEEMSAEDFFRCPEEFCSGSVHEQRALDIVEKMSQIGFIRQGDMALLQAFIIKDLLQDA